MHTKQTYHICSIWKSGQFLCKLVKVSHMESTSSTPRNFESWRLACEAITGLSRYSEKNDRPSRCRSFPIYSVAESSSSSSSSSKAEDKHLNSNKVEVNELNELQDMLENYQEDDDEIKMRGLVEQWKNEMIKTSPMIRFMSKHLSIVGCSPLSESVSESVKMPPILITSCPPGQAGGFSAAQPGRPPSESGILICSNRIMSKSHLENTMAHEMIHWWDHCRFQVDWTNLKHHACTEVRLSAHPFFST